MRHEETAVVHLHGHWTDPGSVVLGVKSYREIMGDRSAQDIMKAIFASTSVIFVGFGGSFQDPNFSGLRDWASDVLKSSDYPPTVLVRQDELSSVRRLYEDDGFQVLQYGDSYADLELFIADLCPAESVRPEARYYDWDSVSGMLRRLHYRIHRQFSPDIVISMSGPGSAAASYCLSLDPSETPLLTAVTFPRNEGRSSKNASFDLLADQSDWIHIETICWDMYLPNVVKHLPPNANVLLFDDKVNSGESQRRVQSFLLGLGLTVKRAALVINSGVRDEMNWYEEVNDGEYFFPWGNRRGRSGVS
jgi:hypoxanthine phosphoribosyltransferase